MREVVVGTEKLFLGGSLGRGGEGEVFAITGRSGQAVKIYNAGLRNSREAKVRAMVSGGLAAKTDLVAYPGQIASDQSGNFLGFLMRLVSGHRPLHELYSPKSRQRYFPKANYRFMVRAALNVARAVGKVHQTGCIIGDLNHSGVLVSRDATVALIDADSFQFRLGGKIYPCLVGVEDFTPPELHGLNLGTVTRTVEHDNFGLAVAIFQLLFMGRHPYAGVHKGPDLSMGESIAQNRFAFSTQRQSETQTSPPPGTLGLDLFPSAVSSAFERAFGLSASARPDAAYWVNALAQLEGALNQCGKVKSHYYPSNAKGCVWCNLAAKSGFDMFPDMSAVSLDIPTDAKGTEAAIREILAFRFPALSEILPQPILTLSGPSNSLQEAQRALQAKRTALQDAALNAKRWNPLKGLVLMAGAALGLFLLVPLWFVWCGIAIWGWTMFRDRSPASISLPTLDEKPFLERFYIADKRVQTEFDSILRGINLTEFMAVRDNLDGEIAAYKRVDDDLGRELGNFRSARETRQREAYLDQFLVRRADISGIGPAKTATLISFGIETAADVEWSAILGVPGFGKVMAQKMMDWRRRHEARFRYNPLPNGQDIIDERALRAKFAGQKAKLETTIRNGLITLRTAKARLDSLSARARGAPALMQALEERARAEHDLVVLGVAVPSSLAALKFTPAPRPAAPNPTPAFPRSPSLTHPSCPKCGGAMRRTAGTYGAFWGCVRFPSCRGTRKI